MWRRQGRWVGCALGVALLSGLFLATGCRSPLELGLFSTSGPGWQVREGQALWRPNHRYPEMAGDLVLATNEDGRRVVHFTKTPLPVVLAQTAPGRWYIEFPPRRLSFSGAHAPPARFLWLHVAAALEGKPLPKEVRFERKVDGGWRLENVRSGESLEGFLTP
jgi:hypothetical protein